MFIKWSTFFIIVSYINISSSNWWQEVNKVVNKALDDPEGQLLVNQVKTVVDKVLEDPEGRLLVNKVQKVVDSQTKTQAKTQTAQLTTSTQPPPSTQLPPSLQSTSPVPASHLDCNDKESLECKTSCLENPDSYLCKNVLGCNDDLSLDNKRGLPLFCVKKTLYFDESNQLAETPKNLFDISSPDLTVIQILPEGIIKLGRFKDGLLDGFSIIVDIHSKTIEAGIRRRDTLENGFRIWSNLTVQYHGQDKFGSNILQDEFYLDKSENMKCKATENVHSNCNVKDENVLYNGHYKFDFDSYHGQLGIYSGKVIRTGFGTVRNTANGDSYTGFFSKDRKNIFGMEKLAYDEIYIGEYLQGFRHGFGMTMSYLPTHRTILVSQQVLNQVNGPGVFLYPDGVIFAGIFFHGKKSGEGIWVDKDNLVYVK